MSRRLLVATAYFLPFRDNLHDNSASRAISLMQNDFSASHQFKKDSSRSEKRSPPGPKYI
jgi:hypothetical protein